MIDISKLLLNKLITRRASPDRDEKEKNRERRGNRGGWEERENLLSA